MGDAALVLAQCHRERAAMLASLAMRPPHLHSRTRASPALSRSSAAAAENAPALGGASGVIGVKRRRSSDTAALLPWTSLPAPPRPLPLPLPPPGTSDNHALMSPSVPPPPLVSPCATDRGVPMAPPTVLPLHRLVRKCKENGRPRHAEGSAGPSLAGKQGDISTGSNAGRRKPRQKLTHEGNISSTRSSRTSSAPRSAHSEIKPAWIERAHAIRSVLQVVPGTVAKKQSRAISTATLRDALELAGQVVSGMADISSNDNADTSGSSTDNSRSSKGVQQFCDETAICSWEDTTLHAFCHGLVATGLSHENSCAFGTYALLPRFLRLTRPASRDLVNAAVEMASAQPRATVQAILLPALSDTPSAACVELTSRVAKTLSADLVSVLLSRLMGREARTSTSNGYSGGGSGNSEGNSATLHASDNTFGLIKALLLKRGISLSPGSILNLTAWFEQHAESNAKNVKFASAVHTLITRHGGNPALVRLLDRVERLLQRLESFMKKSSLAAIVKLRKKHVAK